MRYGWIAPVLFSASLGCHSKDATGPDEPAAPTCFDYATTPPFGTRVPSTGDARQILVDAGVAYVVVPFVGVLVYDISNPAAAVQWGEYSSSGQLDAIAKAGDLLLVTNRSVRQLIVVDVSDPTGPIPLGAIGLPRTPHGLQASGNHAFVSTFDFEPDSELHVVDFSAPSVPRIVVSQAIPGNAFDLALKDAVLYTVTASEPNDFLMYDVSIPTSPRFIAALQTPGPGISLKVEGNRGYVSDGSAGLQILDLSQADRPRLIGNHASVHDALQVSVDRGLAFVYRRPFIEVADIHDPAHTRRLGIMWSNVDAYVTTGGWLYFWSNGTFHSQDFRSARFANVAVSVPLPAANRIVVASRYAFVSAQDRIEILDLSLSSPISAGDISLGTGLLSLARSGSIAYAGDADGTVHVLDMSEPSAVHSLGNLSVSNAVLDLDVVLSGSSATWVCALERRFGVHVIDVSDPRSPRLASSLPLGISVLSLTAGEGIACVNEGNGVRVIDVTTPAHPLEAAFLNEDAVHSIALRGSFLYVATQQELVVYDLTNPMSPLLRSRTRPSPNWAASENIAFDEVHAYVVTGPGVRVFSLVDPAVPQYLGFFDLEHASAFDAASDAARLFITSTRGVEILPVACP